MGTSSSKKSPTPPPRLRSTSATAQQSSRNSRTPTTSTSAAAQYHSVSSGISTTRTLAAAPYRSVSIGISTTSTSSSVLHNSTKSRTSTTSTSSSALQSSTPTTSLSSSALQRGTKSRTSTTSTSSSALQRGTKSRSSTTSTSSSAQHSICGNTATTNATSRGSSSNTFLLQSQPATPRPASQNVRNSANNYVIPAVAAAGESQNIAPRQGESAAKLLVCPQYNGKGCVAKPCRRLHVCYYWAIKTCSRNTCQHDHTMHTSHNQRLLQALLGVESNPVGKFSEIILTKQEQPSRQEGPLICLYNILKKCTKKPCQRVHCAKNYLWEVQDCNQWVQLSYNQCDYLEVMYTHPFEESVDLIPLKTSLYKNKNLNRLASLLSKEASWTADLETMKLKGGSSVLDIRRLSTTSDLTSQVPVATRWLWYWQGDNGCWEPYGEGIVDRRYYVGLSDCLEFILRILNKKFVTVSIGRFSYRLDGKMMIQTNLSTDRVRSVRRRPACSLVSNESIRFDKLFLPLPASKKFLKLPVLSLSSEFIFVENLLKQTLPSVKIICIHRVQNDHLWRAYQTKKGLLTSLYNGDITATNEQYLFHGTGLDVVDHICEENLDWKLSGTNVGCLYGRGTYFSNMASMAHQYTRADGTGKSVMLVVLVLVGKMTQGHQEMILPPMNTASGRLYDTTCNSDSNATIFVKYNREEYYPAYVVTYNRDASSSVF